MKIEQAYAWYRVDNPAHRRGKPKPRDFKTDVIYTRTGIVDMTRKKTTKRGSHVERILLRL